MKLLIVDDEKSICDLLEIVFKRDGYQVKTASSGRAALDLLSKEPFDLIVSDIKMPGISGLDLLKEVRTMMSDVVFVFMTAFASTSTAIQALRMGANNYIIKTENFVDELKVVIEKEMKELKVREENRTLKRELGKLTAIENLIGSSSRMRLLQELIHTVAPTNSTVLITGESGTGKELVARAIHHLSPRVREPFTSINCGAFPETLLESELFGYLKGAFTGASSNKKGLFEVSDRGTVFLDEIGEMSPSMQVKLLRVLQDRRFRPVGGTEEIPIDVRVIAATNRNLQKMVAEKGFREDLYYRISVIPIDVPPLRDRREDIRLLADHFVKRFSTSMNKTITSVDPELYETLEAYDWPGNVRELENTIERAVAFESGEVLKTERLPDRVLMPEIKIREVEAIFPDEGIDFDQQVSEVERKLVEAALRKAAGVQTKAAELLKMTYRSFRHYMTKYNLQK
ncbi:MAG: sigma-54 dependent transcriptional regulator [Acidobacteriia bacterium]|nr:sigma-54 dependent transcriptional regulator [Terriglobia bacterium]